jgi:flavin reductase (DIM6/NTAB) family NADH-FMN oxidoreductase RutF
VANQEREIGEVLEAMPYGLYIVGSTGEAGPNGMMADWVTQVSFKPRLICIALENDAQTLANIRLTGSFTVNFLGEGAKGMAVARRFAAPYRRSKVGGPMAHGVHEKLAHEASVLTARDCPILEAAIAWLECEALTFVSAGDHTLVIGSVLNGRLRTSEVPLTSTYTGWAYSG